MIVAQLFALFGVKVNHASFGAAHGAIKALKNAAIGMAAVGIGRHIAGMAMHATEAATHLVSMTAAMGLTIEQTQEWGHVAERSGSSLQQLSVGFNMVLRNLRQFSEGRGSKVMNSLFRELGTTAAEAKEVLASPDGFQHWLMKTSDSLQKMGDTGHRATFSRIFGVVAGRAVIADMARGSAGLEELFQRRRKMGELTKEEALGMRDMDNRVRDMKSNWEALVSKTIARLAPELTRIAIAMTDWMQANGPLISGVIEAAVNGLVFVFQTLAGAVRFVRDTWRGAMQGNKFDLLLVLSALGALAVFLWTVVIPATLAWAATTFMALAPYIGMGLLIGALVMIVLKLGQIFVDVWHNSISPMIDGFIDGFMGVLHFFQGFWNSLKAGFWESINAIGDSLSGFIDDAIAAFGRLWEGIKDLPIVGWLIRGAISIGHAIGGGDGSDGIDKTQQAQFSQAQSTVTGGMKSLSDSKFGAVNVGPMNVEIHTGADPKHTTDAIKDLQKDHLRHAHRALGGQ